jgi:hypothetical protein
MTVTNILTAAEAAQFIRTDASDPVLLMLLPMVDTYILNATGRDWTVDTSINPVAKNAAGQLLTFWYDNPAAVGESPNGLSSVLMQLEVEALKYRKFVFYGRAGAGSITLPGGLIGDVVKKLIGVYGVSGDQSAKFEAQISVTGQIQQTNGADLSENIYVVILKNPAEDVTA